MKLISTNLNLVTTAPWIVKILDYYPCLYLSSLKSDVTQFFNAILLHKKSMRVTWRLQTIFNATFVARTDFEQIFQRPTTLLQQINRHVTRYRIFAGADMFFVTLSTLKVNMSLSIYVIQDTTLCWWFCRICCIFVA